jgi:hypothetical protein
MISGDPNSLIAAAACFDSCIPAGQRLGVLVYLTSAWVQDELTEACGDISDTIQIIPPAGVAAVAQNYTLQANGSYLSADGVYRIYFVGSFWVLVAVVNPFMLLYYSFPGQFPCSWNATAGHAPGPDGQYVPDTGAFSYTPASAVALQWSDKNGMHPTPVDLAAFITQADPPSVTEITFVLNSGITSVTGLSQFPNLITFDGGSGNQLTTLDISGNPLLTLLEIEGNNLTTAAVNSMLIALQGFGLLNGTVAFDGQAPPAPPSGSGITAATTLTARGWSVLVDT